VVSDAFESNLRKLFSSEGDNGLDLDVQLLLTFALLHEAGHIANGDAGALAPSDLLMTGGELRGASEAKNRELRADVFAVELIKASALPGTESNAYSTAVQLEALLTALQFNLFGRRLIGQFGDQGAAFADTSYSHPNWELRLLIMNYRLSGSRTAEHLLDDYLERRRAVSGTPAGAETPARAAP